MKLPLASAMTRKRQTFVHPLRESPSHGEHPARSAVRTPGVVEPTETTETTRARAPRDETDGGMADDFGNFCHARKPNVRYFGYFPLRESNWRVSLLVRPGATSSVHALSSDAPAPSSVLASNLILVPFASCCY